MLTKINALGTARLAYWGDAEFNRQVRDLQDQIELLERPRKTEAEVLEDWKLMVNELQNALNYAKGKMARR